MIRLLQGDCVELLRGLPDNSVDLVLTDPPYGIDYQSARRTDRSAWKPKILNDKKPFLAFIPELRRILKPTGCAMIFTRWDVQQAFIDEMESSGLRVRSVLIWDKQAHSMGDLKRAYGSRYESILFHSGDGFAFPGKRPQDVVVCPRVSPNKLVHPNEKPVDLLKTLISQLTTGGGHCTRLLYGLWQYRRRRCQPRPEVHRHGTLRAILPSGAGPYHRGGRNLSERFLGGEA